MLTKGVDRRMFTVFFLLLVGEFFALALSLVLPWKNNFIPYVGGVIVQSILGTMTKTTIYGLPPPAPVLAVVAYEGAKNPVTWLLVPLYMLFKPLLLGKAKFREAKALTFTPLAYLVERYLTFPWSSSIFTLTVLPQGGLGVYSLLLGLLAGVFSTNYLVSSILNPVIVEVWSKLKSEGKASLDRVSESTGFPKQLLYTLLAEAAVQGVLNAVVTTEMVFHVNSEEGREAVIALFSGALLDKREIPISHAKKLMKKSGTWFTRDTETIQGILQKAIEEKQLDAVIEGRRLKKKNK
nr:hypothetical protein [Candidatus Bathyarchaeota archaeon]